MSLYYIVSAYLNNGVGKNAPGKKDTEKIAPRKFPSGKFPPGKLPSGQLPQKNCFTVVTNVTKSSCLDIAGFVDLPLSLLGEVFQRYLAVRHIAQLVAHGKTENFELPVLCKIIARKDIIFNKQFRAPTIYRQVLIFVNKFC